MVDRRFWTGRRVFLTGHTGFKGGWLAAWLLRLGSRVAGYALPPSTRPSFYRACRLSGEIHSTLGDIRNPGGLLRAMRAASPSVVFHLAAQALVRASYREPVATLETNVRP